MLKVLKSRIVNPAKKLSLADVKGVSKNTSNNLKKVIKDITNVNYEKGFYDFEEAGYFISDGKVYSIIFPR